MTKAKPKPTIRIHAGKLVKGSVAAKSIRLPGSAAALIHEGRIAAAMTQTELAEAAGVPYENLRRWESGRREPFYRDMAKILAVISKKTNRTP